MVYLNENDDLYYTDEEFTTLATGAFGSTVYYGGSPILYINNGSYYADAEFTSPLQGWNIIANDEAIDGPLGGYYTGWYIDGQPTWLDSMGNGEFNGQTYVAGSTNFTGEWGGTYYINSQATDALGWWVHSTGGTGVFEGTYYINGVAKPGLDENGTGESEGLRYNNGALLTGNFEGTYYINGVATGLDVNGNGVFEGTYYINGQLTDLDSSGNGTWNGQTYVNGVVQNGGGGNGGGGNSGSKSVKVVGKSKFAGKIKFA